LAVVSFATGSTSHGIILLVTSLIAGTSDNILRAWLFSKAANTNPVVSLLALLGGISLFGFPGLFLAPIVEQLVMTYLFRDPNMKMRKESEARNWKKISFRSRPRPI
jgi:predicted PurR-regulated permease PerM